MVKPPREGSDRDKPNRTMTKPTRTFSSLSSNRFRSQSRPSPVEQITPTAAAAVGSSPDFSRRFSFSSPLSLFIIMSFVCNCVEPVKNQLVKNGYQAKNDGGRAGAAKDRSVSLSDRASCACDDVWSNSASGDSSKYSCDGCHFDGHVLPPTSLCYLSVAPSVRAVSVGLRSLIAAFLDTAGGNCLACRYPMGRLLFSIFSAFSQLRKNTGTWLVFILHAVGACTAQPLYQQAKEARQTKQRRLEKKRKGRDRGGVFTAAIGDLQEEEAW